MSKPHVTPIEIRISRDMRTFIDKVERTAFRVFGQRCLVTIMVSPRKNHAGHFVTYGSNCVRRDSLVMLLSILAKWLDGDDGEIIHKWRAEDGRTFAEVLGDAGLH